MLFIFLLACNRQEPQMQQSKRVDVNLQPDIPGDIEISISEFNDVIPESKDWETSQKKRIWSLLHLIESPCESENRSLLSSLKTGLCPASILLKERALRNVDLDDNALIDVLTVPDSWYPDAQQGKQKVTVELWIDEPILAKEKLLSHLKQIRDAQLRVCVRTNVEERIRDYPLPIGQEVSEIDSLLFKNVKNISNCSSSLSEKVRSSPTWFVEGFRLRGFQSIRSIQRLISLSKQDKE